MAATALGIAVLAAMPLAATAGAGVVTEPQRAAVRTPGLTGAERRALTVKSITATADDSVGLVVSVQFRGDAERYLGRAPLEQALLALVLVPKTGNTQSGLVDQGGGVERAQVQVRVSRVNKKVRRAAVDVYGTEHVTRMATNIRAQVIRAANKVIFYLADRAVGRLARVKLKVFASARFGSISPRTRQAVWRRILASKPTFSAAVAVDPSRLSAAQMHELSSDLTQARSAVVAPELRRQQRARAGLGPVSHVPLGISHLQSELTVLGRLTARLGTLIRSWSPSVQVVQTDPGLSQDLASQPALAMSPIKAPGLPEVNVDDAVQYQRFDGIGAAMTDSSAWLLDYQLPADLRLALMRALFGSPGLPNALGAPDIHLNFLRIAIGASGAMTVGSPYTYDDVAAGQTDPSLSDFSVAHDSSYLIPTLQQALAINPGLEILANPWSPPAWMKSNDALDNLGGTGRLLPSAFAPLASYIVKFIEAYERAGIPIDAITPQNEPSSGGWGTPYPGATLPEADEDSLIAQYLSPALRAAGLDTKIYANDHNWDQQPYASGVANGAAADDLQGIAWHCYFGSPTAMSATRQNSPALAQIVDECSPEIRSFGTPEYLISSLRNWARVVSVWSAALDPNGGPIQAANDCSGCRGPVTINEQTQTVTLRPEYYQLGQVSSFVQPGALRIASKSFVSYGQNASGIETITSGLDDVAFMNPDGSKVLIAYNNSRAPISFDVSSRGRHFTYTIPARAMTTFTWR